MIAVNDEAGTVDLDLGDLGTVVNVLFGDTSVSWPVPRTRLFKNNSIQMAGRGGLSAARRETNSLRMSKPTLSHSANALCRRRLPRGIAFGSALLIKSMSRTPCTTYTRQNRNSTSYSRTRFRSIRSLMRLSRDICPGGSERGLARRVSAAHARI